MKKYLAILVALCSLVAAQAASATPGLTSALSATDLAACGDSTNMNLTITAEDPPGVQSPIDVGFVLDESGSISASDFNLMRNTVASWGSSQNFGPTALGASIVQFSSNARLTLPETYVKPTFVNTAATLFQRGGSTDIAGGLTLGQSSLLSGGRPDAPNILILMTDGVDNVGTATLATQVAAIKAAGTTIFAVGVGASVDAAQLAAIASTIPGVQTVYTPATFSGLSAALTQITTTIAPAATNVSYHVTPATGWTVTASSAPGWSPAGFTFAASSLRTGVTHVTYTLQHTGPSGGTVAPQAQALLTYTDPTGATLTQDYAGTTVTVAGCNAPPTADAGPDVSATLDHSHMASVSLDGTGSTDDGQIAPLTYSWSENGTVFSTDAAPTVDLPLGVHTITLTVSDGELTDSDEVVVTVTDPTAPVITPVITGTLGNNGWYTSDVGVSWSVADPESDITSPPCPAATVSSDTAGVSFSCSATSAGGTSSASTPSIKRDATAPVITYSGNLGTYGVADTVAITCSAADAPSGVASATCPGASGPAYLFAGANTLSASATDAAGNVGHATATFVVAVRAADVCGLVDQWVGQKGVANSLCVKLDHGSIQAFVNEVNAQRGKLITSARADTLIALARSL